MYKESPFIKLMLNEDIIEDFTDKELKELSCNKGLFKTQDEAIKYLNDYEKKSIKDNRHKILNSLLIKNDISNISEIDKDNILTLNQKNIQLHYKTIKLNNRINEIKDDIFMISINVLRDIDEYNKELNNIQLEINSIISKIDIV